MKPRRTTSGTASLVLAFALALGCRNSGATSERRDASASLIVESSHDFGRVAQGSTLRHGFALHNGTNSGLGVENATEVLGCAGVPVPRVLEPGADGTFEVTCRASVYGPLRVSLPLRADDRSAGELSLVADVEPALVFDRPVLEVNVAFGGEQAAQARLQGLLAKSAHLRLDTQPPRGIQATVLPAPDGAEGAELRVSGAAVGTQAGSLQFSTGLEQPKAIALAYLVRVTGTLSVSPTNPVLDLQAPGRRRTVVTLTSTRPGFAVKRVFVLEGPFATRLRRTRGGFEVEITIVEAAFPAGARAANGRIRIVSNDRTEPNKELSLFALGRPERP